MKEELNALVEERIGQMEDPSYEYPKRMNRRDYLIAAIAGVICLALVIWGGFLG